jgi:hypothetical protein
VYDGSLESNAITGTIQVIPVNDPPVLEGSYDYNYKENEPMRLYIRPANH